MKKGWVRWLLVLSVLLCSIVGILFTSREEFNVRPIERAQTPMDVETSSVVEQPHVADALSPTLQKDEGKMVDVQPQSLTTIPSTADSRIEQALNACKPFKYKDVLNVTRLERDRLVTTCATATANETLEIVITCRDADTVTFFKERFKDLVVSIHEPFVLRGEVACCDMLPFLQDPPAGVVRYTRQRHIRLYNSDAASPRFLGTSSSAVEGSQGLGYYGLDGSGEIVAVLDTGISSGDYDDKNFHTNLKDGLYGMAGEPTLGGGFSSVKDELGHGTHVCGSIISRGTVNVSTRSAAQGALLFAQGGGAYLDLLSNYSQHFERSSLMGAKILSNSWGSVYTNFIYSNYTYDYSASDVDRFVWNNPEALLLFAVGNDGRDNDGDGISDEKTVLGSEVYAKNVLVVGAQESYKPTTTNTYSNNYSTNEQITNDYVACPKDRINDGMAAFSSRGPLTDGRITPMLVAPGSLVLSTGHASSEAIVGMGGSSMATPQVAAGAAVLRQYLREYHRISNPTAALMRAGLILCADSLYPGQYGTENPEIPTTSPNNVEGWGALHLGKHLAGIDKTGDKKTPQTIGFKDRISLTEANKSTSFTFTTSEVADVRVVLSWIDYYDCPSNKGSPLWNDYNLLVMTPDGKGYSLNDTINPIERITIKDAPIGTYMVFVSCSKMEKPGNGNIAAVAWSATTVAGGKTFETPETPETEYTLTVKLPEDVTAYTDYPIWPAPGDHTFGANEPFSPIAGPKLSYMSGKHGVTHLAGWILFDAEGKPIRQHFPEHETVTCYSTSTYSTYALSGVTQALEKPIVLPSDKCTLQWYKTFPGYGIRLK